jgi:hypothetical protein
MAYDVDRYPSVSQRLEAAVAVAVFEFLVNHDHPPVLAGKVELHWKLGGEFLQDRDHQRVGSLITSGAVAYRQRFPGFPKLVSRIPRRHRQRHASAIDHELLMQEGLVRKLHIVEQHDGVGFL